VVDDAFQDARFLEGQSVLFESSCFATGAIFPKEIGA
jgi:hypothetical protein